MIFFVLICNKLVLSRIQKRLCQDTASAGADGIQVRGYREMDTVLSCYRCQWIRSNSPPLPGTKRRIQQYEE